MSGLKLIMSSELYLSEAAIQHRKTHSAAQSRVAAAMGNIDGIGTQGSGGAQVREIRKEIYGTTR